ncbi:hypothetical protein [Clostridium sp.]|uniref:hypothetical protein n=1 Tax=Clostridium sp. TaxID=1506 RepID=UPI002FCC72C2
MLLEPKDNHRRFGKSKSQFCIEIPATSFASEDVEMEYERLVQAGVEFTKKP